MSEQKNIFDPEVVLPKLKNLKEKITDLVAEKKKLLIGAFIIVAIFLVLNSPLIRRDSDGGKNPAKVVSATVGKSFDFPALNNQGKSAGSKIKFTIANAEKTNQVTVNDKVFTAKNNKLFLILNLELKNDATQPLNIVSGDMVRLSYNNDEDNKFAPDLHNNLVSIAAISTKLDRVGFVVPDNVRNFKIFVGELEGKKETITLGFPS